MKYFLLLIFASNVANADPCIRAPKEHYLKEFSSKSLSVRSEEIQLNSDDLPDYKLTSDEQCGAKGCEGIVYLQTEKGCFADVLLFNGSLRVNQKKKGPYREIQVGTRTYKFNPLRQKYE